MKERWARLVRLAALAPEEQQLAGFVSGLLYTIGGISLASFLVLPGMPDVHPTALLVLSAAAVAWGACSLWLINWRRVPRLLMHASSAAAFPIVAAAIWASGGARSPAWIFLLFIDVFATYFYRRPIAIAYIVGCVVFHALPLLYDPQAHQDAFIGQMILSDGAYIGLGAAIISGRRLMWHLRKRAELLAAEQGALRRVATAVVEGESEQRIYELVAAELAGLIGAGAAGIMRVEQEDRAVVMGSWSEREGGRYERGTLVPISRGGDIDRAVKENHPVRIVGHDATSAVGRLGYDTSIVAPIRANGTTWGVLAVTASEPKRLTREDEQHLMEFGDLLSTAIASIEDRAKLAAQAATDPLTGLANHRTLQQRLSAEVARAERHDTLLSVAVIDIDHFKQINDVHGHATGDRVLEAIASALVRNFPRRSDVITRLGGDEFAVLLRDLSTTDGARLAERLLAAVRELEIEGPRESVTVSVCVGIAEALPGEPAESWFARADHALYDAKTMGRDSVAIAAAELAAVESEPLGDEPLDLLTRSIPQHPST